jgi:hypothetical protein
MFGFNYISITFLVCFLCVIPQLDCQFKIVYNSGRSPGDGPRRFPFLRALVSQFISERSSRDFSKEDGHDYQAVDSHKSKTEMKPQNSNLQSMEHIMDDINSQNVGTLSTKTRGYFLINILSRMLKSVNFTEVSNQTFRMIRYLKLIASKI